jgi:hypothetical protein|tara:strand:+ start:83 stop:307 length:225 start_codon:yes stop_codon:yes gene_type:complete
MVVETTADGWECVPHLRDVVSELKFISNYIYEIENCVRTSDLSSMVEDLNETMDNVKYHLNKINTSVEYKTVDN